jgi:hypothetical protein
MEFVTFDPENGDLNLKLPADLESFHDEICLALSEKFMGDLDDDILSQMNDYVDDWVNRKRKS